MSAAIAANAADLAKAEAAVVRALANLAQRKAANRRQVKLTRQDIASIQRAEEARLDEDVARAEVAVAEAELAVIRAQGQDATAALQLEQTLFDPHRLTAPFDACTQGRFAEALNIPTDTREAVARMPGVADAGAITYQTVETTYAGKTLGLYVIGIRPGRPGGPWAPAIS